jgi:hypothetical protein
VREDGAADPLGQPAPGGQRAQLCRAGRDEAQPTGFGGEFVRDALERRHGRVRSEIEHHDGASRVGRDARGQVE